MSLCPLTTVYMFSYGSLCVDVTARESPIQKLIASGVFPKASVAQGISMTSFRTSLSPLALISQKLSTCTRVRQTILNFKSILFPILRSAV